MRTIIQLLFVFALAFVSLASDGARLSQDNEIIEAVFRHQFNNNASCGQKNSAAVYCLSVGEKYADPSEQLMKRFAGHTPPVRPVSACIISGNVVDKHTAKRGLLFEYRKSRGFLTRKPKLREGTTNRI